MKVLDTIQVKIPTWALPALINNDFSGLEQNEEELIWSFKHKYDNLVRFYQEGVDTPEFRNMSEWELMIDTNNADYEEFAHDLLEELQIEFLGDDEEYSNSAHWEGQIARLCTLKKTRHQDKSEYFSPFPEFGLPCNVQDCTILLLGE